jgi:ADP-heptose:LPS heptosyltransferase
MTLAPLLSLPGVNFVSLQKGQGETEPQSLPAELPLLDLASEIHDFSDSAAIIAQLDLVICVDTAFAHLAGGLGKPCWVLLPARGTDWRWMRERADSLWYPQTVRLFRQSRPGTGLR